MLGQDSQWYVKQRKTYTEAAHHLLFNKFSGNSFYSLFVVLNPKISGVQSKALYSKLPTIYSTTDLSVNFGQTRYNLIVVIALVINPAKTTDKQDYQLLSNRHNLNYLRIFEILPVVRQLLEFLLILVHKRLHDYDNGIS